MEEKRNYKCTDYPKIFQQTYWDRFDFNPNMPEVYEARNQFITMYRIVKNYGKWTEYIHNIHEKEEGRVPLDHTEFYVDEDGDIIMITSPYCEEKAPKFLANGWKQIERLYNHENAFTYLKYFPNKLPKYYIGSRDMIIRKKQIRMNLGEPS